ncbi:MAG: hypothetical protein Q8L88_02160 [Bacteroidota bacterium]|nr:hypothetical protein [Bacteroidota bacterium]
MGQQQLLLLILGAIIIGIAVVVGITIFQDNAISSNKDAVINDLIQLSAKAQEHYRRTSSTGGGGYTYSGIDSVGSLVSNEFSNNDKGRYFIIPISANQILLAGYSKYQNADGTYPAIGMLVTPTESIIGPWINTATAIPTSNAEIDIPTP